MVDAGPEPTYEEKMRLPPALGPKYTAVESFTRVIFYVRKIGLYLNNYKIYGTISIYILKGLAFFYQLIYILHH